MQHWMQAAKIAKPGTTANRTRPLTKPLFQRNNSMATANLTAQRLRELLHYNPETGAFRWHNPHGKAQRKPFAGSRDSSGYTKIGIAGQDYRAHRLAWLYVHGDWPRGQLDHIDGNPSNNALNNLRDVSQYVNQQNQRGAHADSKHGLMGVTKRPTGWMARINTGGVHRYLGIFPSQESAHAAYLAAKRAVHAGCTI